MKRAQMMRPASFGLLVCNFYLFRVSLILTNIFRCFSCFHVRTGWVMEASVDKNRLKRRSGMSFFFFRDLSTLTNIYLGAFDVLQVQGGLRW